MKNFSIAIVDDDKDNHVFLKRIINRMNAEHTVKSFYDGGDLLLYLSEIKGKQPLPDFIILDLTMPQMDGYDVLRMLKAYPEFKNIPIFMLTSGQYEYDRIKSIAYGCTNYYMKPMDTEHLTRIIEDMFRQLDQPSMETTVLNSENAE